MSLRLEEPEPPRPRPPAPEATSQRVPDDAAPVGAPAASTAIAETSPAADTSFGPAHVLRVFGSVVAPVSLLTALMYYFGVLHAFWFFGDFGVDYTVFGLTTQDYLFRSADGLFVPLTAAAAAVLAALWLHRLVPLTCTTRRRGAAARIAAPAAAAVGAALLAIAVVGVLDPEALWDQLTLPGLSLSAGVLLLLAASRLARWRAAVRQGRAPAPLPRAVSATEWGAVLVLVSVGLFWAAGDWSAAVGTRRASQVVAALPTWPDAVLYSERSLNLAVPGVSERVCAQPDAAYAFRYDGLKLITEAGDQLFLLPASWTPGSGTAVVLPATAALRLEFTGAGGGALGTC